jgi:restriction endonuclease Mrr
LWDISGIDGRINQDPLGLDQILVQAKRYAPDRMIDRQTIQAFIGSMTGQGITKGVFITTSGFNEKSPRICTPWRPDQSGAHRRRRTVGIDASTPHRRAG